VERPSRAAAVFSCNNECWLDGFTVSEFDHDALLSAALVDQRY
jgi:hypothetical protein